MRLSKVVIAYFMIGSVLIASGVIPWSQVGVVQIWVDEPEGGGQNIDIEANEEARTGILEGLIGPVKNALGTVAGGGLIAVWGAINKLIGFFAWPLTVAGYIGLPWEAELMVSVLLVAFTFAVLRVFRSSV